jgi:hypothetical protein
MMDSRFRSTLRFVLPCALALAPSVLLALTSAAFAAPEWDGEEAVVYATADNPRELEFAPDGTLYAAHHSPSNGPARLLRVPIGSGMAEEWGDQTPEDPDGIDHFNGSVYSSSEGTIWQANTTTDVMSIWATVAGSPNQSSIVVDEFGSYAQAGSIFVGNARLAADIHLITLPAKTITAFTTSASLRIVRAMQFVQGTLYLTEIDASKGVWSVDAAGVPTKVADGGHAWGAPDAMVYEPDTDTFLVGDGTRLLRLPRGGGAVEEVGTGFLHISGLTFDADGVLYVADQDDDVIWEVSPAIPVPTSGVPALLALALALAGTALFKGVGARMQALDGE